MDTFDRIKSVLDQLDNNQQRNNYLDSIRKNPNIGRHDLSRIICNTMEETNFIESYYKVTIENNLKSRIKKIVSFFKNFSIKRSIF